MPAEIVFSSRHPGGKEFVFAAIDQAAADSGIAGCDELPIQERLIRKSWLERRGSRLNQYNCRDRGGSGNLKPMRLP